MASDSFSTSSDLNGTPPVWSMSYHSRVRKLPTFTPMTSRPECFANVHPSGLCRSAETYAFSQSSASRYLYQLGIISPMYQKFSRSMAITFHNDNSVVGNEMPSCLPGIHSSRKALSRLAQSTLT